MAAVPAFDPLRLTNDYTALTQALQRKFYDKAPNSSACGRFPAK